MDPSSGRFSHVRGDVDSDINFFMATCNANAVDAGLLNREAVHKMVAPMHEPEHMPMPEPMPMPMPEPMPTPTPEPEPMPTPEPEPERDVSARLDQVMDMVHGETPPASVNHGEESIGDIMDFFNAPVVPPLSPVEEPTMPTFSAFKQPTLPTRPSTGNPSGPIAFSTREPVVPSSPVLPTAPLSAEKAGDDDFSGVLAGLKMLEHMRMNLSTTASASAPMGSGPSFRDMVDHKGDAFGPTTHVPTAMGVGITDRERSDRQYWLNELITLRDVIKVPLTKQNWSMSDSARNMMIEVKQTYQRINMSEQISKWDGRIKMVGAAGQAANVILDLKMPSLTNYQHDMESFANKPMTRFQIQQLVRMLSKSQSQHPVTYLSVGVLEPIGWAMLFKAIGLIFGDRSGHITRMLDTLTRMERQRRNNTVPSHAPLIPQRDSAPSSSGGSTSAGDNGVIQSISQFFTNTADPSSPLKEAPVSPESADPNGPQDNVGDPEW